MDKNVTLFEGHSNNKTLKSDRKYSIQTRSLDFLILDPKAEIFSSRFSLKARAGFLGVANGPSKNSGLAKF